MGEIQKHNEAQNCYRTVGKQIDIFMCCDLQIKDYISNLFC